MFVQAVPCAAWGTVCYLVASGPGAECLVVDPGIGVLPSVQQVVAEHRLRPVAALLTHGHVDHTFSLVPLCAGYGVPALLHPADRALLADPVRGIGAELAQLLRAELGVAGPLPEPDDVRLVQDGQCLDVAGLAVEVLHAPGHTPGSVMFGLAGAPSATGCARTVLAGDVVFAGSIGRTDLPGGDAATMRRTLATVVQGLPDDTLLLPGHGPVTTMARERRANPFLQPFGD